MALDAKGMKFCKVTHFENGRMTTRRIHLMVIQAANGRVFHLTGDDLPDSIILQSGVSFHGAHVAQVLLNPESAKATLSPPTNSWLTGRDIFFAVMGYVVLHVVVSLATATAEHLM